MAEDSDAESSSSERGYSSWTSYYSRRTGGDGARTHGEISELAEAAVNDPNQGGEYLASVGERAVLLVPGGHGRVRMIHQAFYDSENQKFIGISGLGLLSPFVEIGATQISENMFISRPRPRGEGLSRVRVPSYSDFLGLEPGGFLSATGNTDNETASNYVRGIPNYFIAHLDTLEFFHRNGREEVAEDVIEAMLVGMDMPEESMDDLEIKYGRLLRFLWLLGKGIGQPPPLEPVDATGDQELADRLTAIREKLHPQEQGTAGEEPRGRSDRPTREATETHRGDRPSGRDHSRSDPSNEGRDRGQRGNRDRSRDRGRRGERRSQSRNYDGRGGRRSPRRGRSRDRRDRAWPHRDSSSTSSHRSRSRSSHRRHRRRSGRRDSPDGGSRGYGRGRRDRRSRSRGSSSRPRNRRDRESDVRVRYSERERSRSRSRGSRGRRYSHRRSRSRSREGVAASSSLTQEEVVRGMLQINQLLGASQVEQRAREAKKRSVLGKFDDEQRDLFDLLAAEDFDDRRPRMCSEARHFFEDKDLAHLQGVVNGWQRRWGGTVRTNALIQFTASGYLAPDSPGGFTVFMMSPKKERPRLEQKARERALRRQFNDDDDIDENDIKYYAKSDYFVTETLDQAATQLEMACDFLDKVTRRGSIASVGYEWTLSFVRRNKGRCEECFERDPHFPIKLLHTTDSVFQLFCTNLLEYRHRREPIRAAKRELQYFMQDLLQDKFRDILLGSLPHLELPRRLPIPTENDPDGGGKKLGGKRQGGGGGGGGGNDKSSYENPDETPEKWKLPKGARVTELFDRGTSKGMQNSSLLPTVKHHLGQKQVLLCPKYALLGICRKRCDLGHVPTSKLSKDQVEAVEKAVAAARKSS